MVVAWQASSTAVTLAGRFAARPGAFASPQGFSRPGFTGGSRAGLRSELRRDIQTAQAHEVGRQSSTPRALNRSRARDGYRRRLRTGAFVASMGAARCGYDTFASSLITRARQRATFGRSVRSGANESGPGSLLLGGDITDCVPGCKTLSLAYDFE